MCVPIVPFLRDADRFSKISRALNLKVKKVWQKRHSSYAHLLERLVEMFTQMKACRGWAPPLLATGETICVFLPDVPADVCTYCTVSTRRRSIFQNIKSLRFVKGVKHLVETVQQVHTSAGTSGRNAHTDEGLQGGFPHFGNRRNYMCISTRRSSRCVYLLYRFYQTQIDFPKYQESQIC